MDNTAQDIVDIKIVDDTIPESKQKNLFPLFDRIVLIAKPNPYIPKKTKSGIHKVETFRNSSTNETVKIEASTIFAEVVEIGPSVTQVAIGDEVIINRHAGIAVDFYEGHFVIIHEGDVILKITE